MPDLSALMSQMQAMMSPHEGSVNWTLAKDVARRTVAEQPDPSPTERQAGEIADALRLADHWLDSVDGVRLRASPRPPPGAAPSGSSRPSTSGRCSSSRSPSTSCPRWAARCPPEAQQMAGPLMGLLGQAGGAMFGSQVGQALGGLAGEVLSASDIGLPLGPGGKAALLPANVAAFAEGLDVGQDDVLLYLALREAAHQRLFAHVPWLRGHLLAAVEDYGRGTTIDMSKIESSMRDIDPTNPASIQEALDGGLFEPEKSPAQQAALTRLETILALVEGWVDEVVGQATETRMPAAAKMQEAVRRRRAAGGPAESTFAALVGLELRPRRLRDASALWGSLRSRKGQDARDAVWSHPDLLPTSADLDDPLGFQEGSVPASQTLSDDEFDAALAELLDHESGENGDTGDDTGGGQPTP